MNSVKKRLQCRAWLIENFNLNIFPSGVYLRDCNTTVFFFVQQFLETSVYEYRIVGLDNPENYNFLPFALLCLHRDIFRLSRILL